MSKIEVEEKVAENVLETLDRYQNALARIANTIWPDNTFASKVAKEALFPDTAKDPDPKMDNWQPQDEGC